MLDLWLVRHAESLGNLDGTGADTELSPLGEEQARGLTRALSGFTFDAVYSSPLLRARQTAALALPGCTAIVDDRLAELQAAAGPHFVDTGNPAELAALLATPAPAPEESGKAFMARVRAFLSSLPQEGSVLAFTHHGVVREALTVLLGFRHAPQETAFTGVFRLAIRSGVPAVLVWHDDAHVSGRDPA